ncbi:hypothetical protein [Natrinema versiforme]|uniref:Uncharacterized protein n=1 Tax=Natrinema versiforme JCM 10478 TaxID=1227496 RepID=L9Y3U8_9EURY|nr:hypothetical protein [Natrinema versiforme]ELY68730.1 hypothetical protein C489_06503 [Natrinema versiforme JCM 10478]
MSTQHLQSTTDAEPTPDRTTIRTPRSSPLEDPRTATDRAQRMFSHGDTGRLENLIDEWNAAFANKSADGS